MPFRPQHCRHRHLLCSPQSTRRTWKACTRAVRQCALVHVHDSDRTCCSSSSSRCRCSADRCALNHNAHKNSTSAAVSGSMRVAAASSSASLARMASEMSFRCTSQLLLAPALCRAAAVVSALRMSPQPSSSTWGCVRCAAVRSESCGMVHQCWCGRKKPGDMHASH